MKIVVIGSGIMAGGIAAGFLVSGASVVLLGRSTSKLAASCDQALKLAAGMGGDEAALTPRATVALFESFEDWSGTDLVIETVAEDFALKRQLFADLDRRVPPAIPIGSNSSSYAISKIADGLASAHRMFNTHYFMPAHVVPLVEVVMGQKSDEAIGLQVCQVLNDTGKRAVLVRKELPGFLANRIQHALMREVLSLVDQGVASPEDVDVAVRYSFGFRYAAIGPILQKEISGWDTTLSASREIYPSLSNTTEVPRALVDLVGAGHAGMKSGEGFLKWTDETAAKTRRGYERRLKRAFELLSDDDTQ